MDVLYCLLIGYNIGMLNPAYAISKLRGFDIRDRGSGNAGATNVLLVMGKWAGIATMMFDIMKAFIAIRLTAWLFPTMRMAYTLTSTSCVIGHVFPISMKFRGGKGVSCLGGIILAFSAKVFVILLAAEVAIAVITNYLVFVPLTASVIYPVVYWRMSGNPEGMCLLLIIAVIMLYKHIENLKRIPLGTEMHFSYLWNKEEEMTRVQNNMDSREIR